MFAPLLAAGEFEPHANCWMGWPDSAYLWRDNAKPAQKQYADIAKAISKFEPVVMIVNPEVSSHHMCSSHACLTDTGMCNSFMTPKACCYINLELLYNVQCT